VDVGRLRQMDDYNLSERMAAMGESRRYFCFIVFSYGLHLIWMDWA
jgi:hypothetical protein